ncbi:MAG: hypothetical protein PHW01_03360 [Patescibacteria group bacterium]|nr:hypothetical protein [Patescibacteria group bacterium]
MLQKLMQNKKVIIIGVIIFIVMIIILAVIIPKYLHRKKIQEKYGPVSRQEEKIAETAEELEQRSAREKAQEEATIHDIESKIKNVLAGNNNVGQPYLRISSLLVVRQMTKEENYGVSLEFNTDYYLDTKTAKRNTLLKMGEILKTIYTSNEHIATVTLHAYMANISPYSGSITEESEVYGIILDKKNVEQAKIDWNQDSETLSLQVLPRIWQKIMESFLFGTVKEF